MSVAGAAGSVICSWTGFPYEQAFVGLTLAAVQALTEAIPEQTDPSGATGIEPSEGFPQHGAKQNPR